VLAEGCCFGSCLAGRLWFSLITPGSCTPVTGQTINKPRAMKKLIGPASVALSALLFLSGCVAAIGNRGTDRNSNATLGQQLIDLQKAKESGAITEAEYEAQKAKLLGNK
jgi:hypothetical protein